MEISPRSLPPEARVNETLRFSVFTHPGTSHSDGIMLRAERAVELGMISGVPVVEFDTTNPQWPVITITCKTEDRSFWFGFYLGRDWCVNNRQLTVGCD